MWTEIKEFFYESTNQNLAPQRLHCDNETALINTVKLHFPLTKIVSCLFHLKTNYLKKLDQIGLKNRSEELTELFTTINGLLFLNLACNIQFSMAQTFIDQIIAQIDFLLPKESERPKFLLFYAEINTGFFKMVIREIKEKNQILLDLII